MAVNSFAMTVPAVKEVTPVPPSGVVAFVVRLSMYPVTAAVARTGPVVAPP